MSKIKIENFHQLNELVAEQLGYIKYAWTDECSQFTAGAQWNYGGEYYEQKYTAWVPEEIYNRTEREWETDYENSNSKYYHYSDLEEYIDDKWLYTVPNFSNSYEAMEIIVKHIIDKGLEIKFWINKKYSICLVHNYESNLVEVCCGDNIFSENPINSLPLTVCLAFLEYKNIEVELN